MGSLQLDCPLCCNQTFPCHNSLKHHLLSITDNLSCSICRQKFEQVLELAMHIGRKCLDEDENVHVEIRDEEGNLLNISESEEKSEETSLLIKALTQPLNISMENEINESEIVVEVQKANQMGEEDELYYCSSCSIYFNSIESHVAEFHQGHEVFFKSDQEEEEEPAENAVYLINDETNDGDDEVEEIAKSDEEVAKSDEEVAKSDEEVAKCEVLDTLTEEDCVDKDGNWYTRKVVKIEKFWDENDTVKLSQQTPGEFFQCITCELNFETIELYHKHVCNPLELELDKRKCKRCKICGACFVTSHYLGLHMKASHRKLIPEVTNSELFVCTTCNTSFHSFKSLRLHQRMHEPVKAKMIERPVNYDGQGQELETKNAPREMFICEICNKPYDKEYEEIHKKFHNQESDFNCETCNRKFHTLENLSMHMRAHVDTKKFICSYCKKGFLTQEKLDAHLLTKCQNRQYECQFCGRRFARPHEKVKHERIHTGEKPHKCEICGKAFRVSYCLTLHMRTHSGTRPYKCGHCGKRFKAHSVYNHHLLTHSDDRKYKCPFCPKTFKTGVQLAGHKNSHIKPFICTKCHRPFASLYAVRAHMETHERQNNLKYQCPVCGATYARAFALRDHVKEQHSQEIEDTITIETETILESDEYSNIETHSAVLPDGEQILIDVDSEDVENITI